MHHGNKPYSVPLKVAVLENTFCIPYLIFTQAKKHWNLLKFFTGEKLKSFFIQSKCNGISVADAWESWAHYKYPYLDMDLYLQLSSHRRF